MQLWGVPRSLGAETRTFNLRSIKVGNPIGRSSRKRLMPGTRMVYVSNPNNPTGAVLSEAAMKRIVDRCDEVGRPTSSRTMVYLGAEISRPLTKSFWGMSDRVIVTSGLSKAYGIPEFASAGSSATRK